MSSYMFRQRCRPVGDFRIPQIIEFLNVMKKAFRTEAWYDDRGRPVDLSHDYLHRIFQKRIDKLFPGIGVNEDFFSIPPRNRDDNTVRLEVHTGTHSEEIFHDYYNISMGDARKVPNFSYLRRSIGGIDSCLRAPAWKVERLCQGVLIQLVKGLFDSDNPEHIKIQKEANKYFRLW